MGIDFAGGIVVHITAGIAALVTCVVIGPRRGYPETPMPPHNLTMTVTGAAMLWVGWYGFNGGSALAANGQAGMAMLVTQISPSVAALVWMAIEWVRFGKPSMLGFERDDPSSSVQLGPFGAPSHPSYRTGSSPLRDRGPPTKPY